MNIADDLVRAFNDGYEKGKADAEAYLFHCGDTDEPQTNADRLRQMTDEELAEFLVMRDLSSVINFNKALGNYAHLHYDKKSSVVSVSDWLKSPVDEVDNG